MIEINQTVWKKIEKSNPKLFSLNKPSSKLRS